MTGTSSLSLVDTHCHLSFDAFDHDRIQVIERAREYRIVRILNPRIDLETSHAALKCSREFPEVYAAVGVHPNSGLSWTPNSISELKQLAAEQKVVAIGEIGLDYYRDHAPRELQRSIFPQQLELAADLGLPVIIHNRNASEDTLDILKNWHQAITANGSKIALAPGVMHSFSGSIDFALEMVALRFKIGITGPVTFHNSQVLQSVVSCLPLESLLIETDAPYLSPHPYRGKRNEPANVRIVAQKIAEIKADSMDHVAKITTEEANKLFSWRIFH